MTKSDITLIKTLYAFVILLFLFAVALMATTNDISTLWKFIFTGFMSIAITIPPMLYFWNKTINQKSSNKTTILEMIN